MIYAQQPEWCCHGCGTRYGYGRTADVSTVHLGECGVCQSTNVVVTEPRDYGYLKPEWKNHAVA